MKTQEAVNLLKNFLTNVNMPEACRELDNVPMSIMTDEIMDYKSSEGEEILKALFPWDKSPQGENYWKQIPKELTYRHMRALADTMCRI